MWTVCKNERNVDKIVNETNKKTKTEAWQFLEVVLLILWLSSWWWLIAVWRFPFLHNVNCIIIAVQTGACSKSRNALGYEFSFAHIFFRITFVLSFLRCFFSVLIKIDSYCTAITFPCNNIWYQSMEIWFYIHEKYVKSSGLTEIVILSIWFLVAECKNRNKMFINHYFSGYVTNKTVTNQLQFTFGLTDINQKDNVMTVQCSCSIGRTCYSHKPPKA